MNGSRIINNIQTSHLDELITKLDWSLVRDKLRNAQRRDTNLQPFGLQRKIFHKLGMPELFGLDAPIWGILKDLPHFKEVNEGMEEFYYSVVRKIQKQLRSGGSTLFFDVDRLSTTQGAILIDDLLRAKRAELQNLVLEHDKDAVDLWPLWMTGYGFKILRNLGMKRRTTLIRFNAIKKMFEEIRFSLTAISKKKQIGHHRRPKVSSKLQELIQKSMSSSSFAFLN